MEQLFDAKQATISEHISNIMGSGEFDDTSIGISNKSSGGRKPRIYNLDMILSVGYQNCPESFFLFCPEGSIAGQIASNNKGVSGSLYQKTISAGLKGTGKSRHIQQISNTSLPALHTKAQTNDVVYPITLIIKVELSI